MNYYTTTTRDDMMIGAVVFATQSDNLWASTRPIH